MPDDYVQNGNLVTRQQSEGYNREMQGQPPKSDHENSIGVILYWIIVYSLSIVLGAICESIADILSVFTTPGVHVVFGDLPMLIVIVVAVAIGLTFFLGLSEKLIHEAISKTTPAFATFSLVVIFIGSHLAYDFIKRHHDMKSQEQMRNSAFERPMQKR